jgi:hypothetical protein
MGLDVQPIGKFGTEEDEYYDLDPLPELLPSDKSWLPQTESFDDFLELEYAKDLIPKVTEISLSEFTHVAFRMPTEDGGAFENFSFKGRRHMVRIYDTPAKRILLVCARQVEKSTLLGNRAIAYSCLVPGFKTLYVSPTSTQTKTFSVDRLKEPIETSPILRAFTTTMLSQNVFEKQFVNWSKITLRNAFLNADRTRGIPAWMLECDEFQDILSENIPVIEQCTSHAPEKWKRFCYAGTPKSLDNNIEYYRSQLSTQGEWAVPCDRCGSDAQGAAGRYWNILGEKNLGKNSLICEKCGKQIYPQHDESQWVNLVQYNPKTSPFESYRIPQLMVPWKSWDEIMLDYVRYPRDKFYNEVLGLSYDSGMRPLTMAQVRECCHERMSMHPAYLERLKKKLGDTPVFMGTDWGCHDEQTRILTKNGFKFFKDLTDEEFVAQWEPETRAMSFVKPKVRTVREWDQPLLHFETKGGLDLMVTHTHRMRTTIAQRQTWLTESARETAERGGNVNFVGRVEWEGEEKEIFILPGVPRSAEYSGSSALSFQMDGWLELLGYLITEGGLCYDGDRPSCLKMSQRETVNYKTYLKMQTCLDRLSIPFSRFQNEKTGDVNWTIYGKQFWKWYGDSVGTSSENKRVPREFLNLNKRQLRILFQALVDGDGYTDPREGCTGGAFYSTSKGLCEDFQEICIRLGLRCVVRLHKPAEGNHQTRWRALWSEGRDYNFNTPSSSVKKVPYRGKVYCCAVPSGYIVTERNGCVSYQGNTGEHTYTVVCLGAYFESMFRIFYIHRCTGAELEPPVQEAFIDALIDEWKPLVIGADYGGGFHSNDHIVRKVGPKRLAKFQYMARAKRKVEWDPKLLRYKVHRTEVMSDIFNAIKRKKLQFPRWVEMQDPFAQDMCNIFAEYNEQLRMIQYDHSQDRPDDSFHAVLYCFLASMIKYARPDIISPLREDQNRGPVFTGYTGPNYQG